MACGLVLPGVPGLATAESDPVAEPPKVSAGDFDPEFEALMRQGLREQFEGRYDQALQTWARLQALHPKDPGPPVFETNTLYWILLHDDEDMGLDERIQAACERGVELAAARLKENDEDAYAHLMMGQSLMNLGRLNGWRGRYYAAGRDGEKARKHLERALELRPGWADAQYHLGLYYFYASLIPQLVTKWLGWLWFIPTGNAEQGVALVENVAENGDLNRDEARFILANIYTYHVKEKREKGLQMVRDLHARFPDNAMIHFELIESLHGNELYAEAIAESERLEAKEAPTDLEAGRANVAKIWRAQAELLHSGPERALEVLATSEEPLVVPRWGGAWLDLTRGRAYDVMGRRADAIAAYEKVIAYKEPYGSRRAARLATQSIEVPYELPRPVEISAAE